MLDGEPRPDLSLTVVFTQIGLFVTKRPFEGVEAAEAAYGPVYMSSLSFASVDGFADYMDYDYGDLFNGRPGSWRSLARDLLDSASIDTVMV